jgi:nitroreductase
MELKELIAKRRAYRSLAPVSITKALMDDLAECARLAPSCFNKQPWRYIFIHDPDVLKQMRAALSSGNEWVHYASLIIVVLSKNDMDCLMKDGREYYAYDVGMATGFMILRATELGLVAHPIAGYDPAVTRQVLGIPKEMEVITLVNVGKHTDNISPVLSEKQIELEKHRPERLPLDKIYCENGYAF